MNSRNDGQVVRAGAGDVPAAVPASNEKPWVTLSVFEVTCQGLQNVRAPVYANGLQQVPIQILIEARDADGVVVPVDESSLSLKLVDYNNPSGVPSGIFEWPLEMTKYVYNWTAQLETPVPGGAGADEPSQEMGIVARDVSDAKVQVFNKWISMTKVGTAKLAAKVTSPDGVVFVSNTPNPGPGKFDSYILVDGRAPKVIPWDEVTMTKVNAFNDQAYDVDVYYVYFKDPNLTIVDTTHSPGYHADYKHYGWRQGDSYRQQVCFRCFGGARKVTWKSHPGIRSCEFMVNDRPGQATVARILVHLGYFIENYRRYGVYLGLIDQFGNESRVGIHPIKDGNEITLVDPNTKALDLPAEPEPGPAPEPPKALSDS